MKRYWLVTENDQFAVYDSKEKTITEWVNQEYYKGSIDEIIINMRNTLERHDEEIGDVEDVQGNPLIEVVGQSD